MAVPSVQWRVILVVAAFAAPRFALAQEIEPRVFVPSPTGVTFVAVVLGRSTGGVLTDPSLPVDNVEAEIDSSAIGVAHTFGLAGRLATAGLILPRIAGHFSGTLDGEDAEASRSGLGDLRARFSLNLVGTPALTPAEFAKRRPTTTLGVALTVSAPTGDYHPDKLINIGTNRWAIKPEIGVAHPVGHWYFEAIAGAWLFGHNDDFFGGHHREQEPLASIQGHVSYTFRPRLWLAFDATFYDGGRTKIDDVLKDDRQSNSRYGITFSVPLSRTQSLKFNWNDGASTRIGSDFTTYGVAWQYTHLP